MGKMQRNKGAGYEREVAKQLTDALATPVSRQLGQARDGGADIHIPGFYVECKRRAAIAVYDWLDQCNRAAQTNGSAPLVVCRADNQESLAILRFADLIPMLKMWIDANSGEDEHEHAI